MFPRHLARQWAAGALMLVVLVPALWVAGGCEKLKDRKAGEVEEKPGQAPLGEPVATLSALALWDAYEQNPLGADQKYKGKVILLTGGAARVLDRGGRYYLNLWGAQSLRTGNVAPGVIGRIDQAAEADFASLKKQDVVDVIGVCAGKRTDWPGSWKDYYILVDHCKLK